MLSCRSISWRAWRRAASRADRPGAGQNGAGTTVEAKIGAMQKKKILMIGNSHIDPVWLWRDREGYQAARSTFASALERMEEFPEFEYTASTTAFDVWLEEHCPELLEKIRARVEEGRWHLAGGWWVEPDCNIPSGESLVRQGLYGQRELLRLFGRTAECGYNVDSFGHPAGLPAILAGQRLPGYVFMRPQPDQMKLPAPSFRWIGEDGSAVTASHCEGEYCAWTRTAIVTNLDTALAHMEEAGLDALPVYYGVGNHGGGPTVENIKCIRELKLERPELDMENAGPADYFRLADTAALPSVYGELEHVFPGCYTVDAELKGLCRACETALKKAEVLSVMAQCAEAVRPRLTEAWKLLLFCQFHDIMAGTARKEARDDAVCDLHRCLSLAREVTGTCMQHLSNRFDLRGDGFPLLVVNPTDRPYEGLVETDVEWRSKFPVRLKDWNGEEQVCDTSVIRLTAPDVRKHFVFRGRIPAFGAAVYRLMPEAPVRKAEPMNCPDHTLENRYLRATVDPATGRVDSLWDKLREEELLSAPVELAVYEDARDTWGSSELTGGLRGVYRAERVYREENGALRTTITCRMAHGRSEALLRWSLAAEERMLRLEARVDSREKLAMTVLRIPLKRGYEEAVSEAAYTETVRPFRGEGERNMQRYVDLTDGSGGLLVLNRAKYGYRCHEDGLEILLMRGSVHAFSGGEILREDREYDYADQGPDTFTLAFHPHDGPLSRAVRIRMADQLHLTPETLLAEQHTGNEPRRMLCDIEWTGAPDCCLTVMKAGEDGGITARIQSCTGETQTGTLTVHGCRCTVTVPPYALSTVHLDGAEGRMTDLLEIIENER